MNTNREDGAVWSPGDTIPGAGKIVHIEQLFGWRDRLFGRFHRHTRMQIALLDDGLRVKIVAPEKTAIRTDSMMPTLRAARYLGALRSSNVVPSVLFADSNCIVLEYVNGKTIDAKNITDFQADTVGRLIGKNQVILENTVDPMDDFRRYSRILASDMQEFAMSPDEIEQRGVVLRPQTTPYAICFADAALKNFIHSDKDRIVYVDAFGILEKHLGAAFIGQALRIPTTVRRHFIAGYYEVSQYEKHIQSNLRFYAMLHLLERAAVRVVKDHSDNRPAETNYRKKQRRSASADALQKLVALVRLPDTADIYEEWLLNCDRIR